MARQPAECKRCTNANALLGFSPPKLGEIRFLPDGSRVPSDSVFRSPGELSGGVPFEHPCVIIEQSHCGHLVRCLPCTSFGGMNLREKWPGMHERARYAILRAHDDPDDHQNAQDAGMIARFSGDSMQKTTYVNCSESYWIEPEYLRQFRPRPRRQPRVVSTESRKALIIAAERHARRPRSPTPPPSATPSPPPFSNPSPQLFTIPAGYYGPTVIATPAFGPWGYAVQYNNWQFQSYGLPTPPPSPPIWQTSSNWWETRTGW